mgnify:CR=1 FL=1
MIMGESSIGWLNPPPMGRTLLFGSPAQPGYTFNAWIGCAKVDPECKNCYAEREAERGRIPTFAEAKRLHLPVWGKHAPRHFAAESTWRLPERWDRLADKAGSPRWCFGGSQMDWLEDRDDLIASRARLISLIERTRNLRWVLLTKRPQDFARLVPSWARGVPSQPAHELRVDFRRALRLPGLRWFLIGGENAGVGAVRPNNLEWMREALAQAYEVPTVYRYVKQLGSRVFGVPACPGCEGEMFEGAVCPVCSDVVSVVAVALNGRELHDDAGVERRAGSRYLRVMNLQHRTGEDWREWPPDLQVQEWPDGAAFIREDARAAC